MRDATRKPEPEAVPQGRAAAAAAAKAAFSKPPPGMSSDPMDEKVKGCEYTVNEMLWANAVTGEEAWQRMNQIGGGAASLHREKTAKLVDPLGSTDEHETLLSSMPARERERAMRIVRSCDAASNMSDPATNKRAPAALKAMLAEAPSRAVSILEAWGGLGRSHPGTSAWAAFFSAFPALRDAVPAGANELSEGISVATRQLTNVLTQPLTALIALHAGGCTAESDEIVVHVVGAENEHNMMTGIAVGAGYEAFGGDAKWALLQALLPGNPRLSIVFVGPDAEAHAPRAVNVKLLPKGRAKVTVSAHKCLYQSLPVLPRPHLVLAQNAGLQHGPHFQEWMGAFGYFYNQRLLVAFTMYDAGERVRSIKYMHEYGTHPSTHRESIARAFREFLKPESVVYNGRNPLGSLFLGECAGDCFSCNHDLLIGRMPDWDAVGYPHAPRGYRVALGGLQSEPALNGRSGICGDNPTDPSSGQWVPPRRCDVHLEAKDGKPARIVRVKLANFRCVDATTAAKFEGMGSAMGD